MPSFAPRAVVDVLLKSVGVTIHRWPSPHTVLRHLQLFFERMEVDCVVDVGANRGQFARSLRDDIGFKGHILSFEPHPELHAGLREASAGDPRWRVEAYAVGREDGRLPFFITGATDNASMLKPNEFGRETFGDILDLKGQIEVPVRRLDDVLPALLDAVGARRPFLKIDTQGFDLEVLAGAEGVHERLRGVLIEAALQHSYDGMPDITASLDALRGSGFDPTGFFSVATDAAGALVEVDIVAQRRRAL